MTNEVHAVINDQGSIDPPWAFPTDLQGSLGEAASFLCCNFLNPNSRHLEDLISVSAVKDEKLLLVVSLSSPRQNIVGPSTSTGDWFQGPVDTTAQGCSSPSYKMG